MPDSLKNSLDAQLTAATHQHQDRLQLALTDLIPNYQAAHIHNLCKYAIRDLHAEGKHLHWHVGVRYFAPTPLILECLMLQ